MIQIKNQFISGWEAAIRGMRNPMNSWEKSDSDYRLVLCKRCDTCQSYLDKTWDNCAECEVERTFYQHPGGFLIGPNDLSLMRKLAKAGSDHAKYRRMINVTVDVNAPLYWWKEFDTYKVGTVANSCSTMHKIAEKEFTLDDFSHEHLSGFNKTYVFEPIIATLNTARSRYINFKNDKEEWWQIIQLLPSSYNQRRTVQLNYEVLARIYPARKAHKLDEWVTFCHWIEQLPYSELITLKEESPNEDEVRKGADGAQ